MNKQQIKQLCGEPNQGGECVPNSNVILVYRDYRIMLIKFDEDLILTEGNYGSGISHRMSGFQWDRIKVFKEVVS